MSNLIAWIAAEAERPEIGAGIGLPKRRQRNDEWEEELSTRGLPAHQFPAEPAEDLQEAERQAQQQAEQQAQQQAEQLNEEQRALAELREREQRVYRGRTVAMLRRYMRYSIETGRLPSLLGTEFFRAKVTAYTVVTFEDRVIFVHDMEKCLDRLDEFSRQLIARHILQEHDQLATSRLLHCSERTVRAYVPIALDVLSEILLDVGLLERIGSIRKNSCQGGKTGPFSASDCDDGK